MTESLLDQVPGPVLEVARRLVERGHGAWVVGGSVRDLLLGRDVHDWDLASSARPAEVKAAFRRVVPTGEKHGTVTVLHGGMQLEVTTLRGEGAYSDGRHPDRVSFVDDIREDLARRDLTINAMALELESGELVDPFGGQADLAARLVRAVGEPAARFNEDGLRPLRAVRLATTMELALDPATQAAIPAALGTFRRVSAERVRDELLKLLSARRPAAGLRLLLETGLLAEVLPELARTAGLEQGGEHEEDAFEHTVEVVEACPPEPPELRLAALLHDVGKAETAVERRDEPPLPGRRFEFPDHEAASARLARARLEALRLPSRIRDEVAHLVRHHGLEYDPGWSEARVRRLVVAVGERSLDALLALRRADLGTLRTADRRLGELDELERRIRAELSRGVPARRQDLAVDGRDLMASLGLPPGPRLGELLDALLERVIDEPELNDRDRLLALARDLLAG